VRRRRHVHRHHHRAPLNPYYPFQVLLPARETGLPRDCKAQAEQVRSIAVGRVSKRVGRLPASLVAEPDRALRVHLSL
jgi:mRNA interferase MazF